jgi:hypothetical protein
MDDTDTVMRRDNRLCRFKFPRCRTRATTILLAVPDWLGGASSDGNARAACRSCAAEQQQQRNRAAELFGYTEGWG